MEFPQAATKDRSFRQLREHLVKGQAAIKRMAKLVRNQRSEKRVHTKIPAERGKPFGHKSDCQKSRTQGHSKAYAELVLVSFFIIFSSCHSTSSHSFFFFISCSFWGKFGERKNKPTTVTIRDPCHLFNLITDTTKEISTLRLCTDDILEAVYTSVNDNASKGTKNNIFIAAFTTSYARLKLYESLDLLQQQVLYYDTDSVIYKWREGQPSIATGDFLGEWKDELQGDSISEFVS